MTVIRRARVFLRGAVAGLCCACGASSDASKSEVPTTDTETDTDTDTDADADTDTDADTDAEPSTLTNADAPPDYQTPGGVDLVGVPSGSFTMGSSVGEPAEAPVHIVTITSPFWISRSEVTQAQWESAMGPWAFDFAGCATCPAESLAWSDAALFANATSASEGLPPCYGVDGSDAATDPALCAGYRLPTEAEWEYAAKAGETYEYAGSDDHTAVAWTSYTTDGTVMPVCTKSPNAWGLCDMSGNVHEWVADWYDPDYYADSPSSDPFSDRPVEGWGRSGRGGNFANAYQLSQVAVRAQSQPDSTSGMIGLRLARSVLP